MKYYSVITGDIIHFTKLQEHKREELILNLKSLIKSWVKEPNWAEIYRGDSFQCLFDTPKEAIEKSIQLICWFKMQENLKVGNSLGTRISIGIGEIAYTGKSVLESDGEAFHLSGRNFDKLKSEEFLSIRTRDDKKNTAIAIILNFANIFIKRWTKGQAEVIYLSLNGYTQEKMAHELGIKQSPINNRLKLANWKTMQLAIQYIAEFIRN